MTTTDYHLLQERDAEILRLKEVIRQDCEDEEAARLQFKRVLDAHIVDGDSYGVPTVGDLAEIAADEILRLKGELAARCDYYNEVCSELEHVKDELAEAVRLHANFEELLTEATDQGTKFDEDNQPYCGVCNMELHQDGSGHRSKCLALLIFQASNAFLQKHEKGAS